MKLVNTSRLLNASNLRKGSALQCQHKRLKSDLYEPDYLIVSYPPTENMNYIFQVYKVLNIQKQHNKNKHTFYRSNC